jgi:O-antigen ligase
VSGWLPPLIAVGVIALLRVPRLGIWAGLTAVPAGLLFLDRFRDALWAYEHYSVKTRIIAWDILASIVSRSPIFGLGPANYYHYTPLFPILGWYVSFNSHNNYLDIVAQTGLVGLGAFLWFSAEMFLLANRVRKQHQGGFPLAFSVGALGGLAGSLAAGMLGDWIIPFVYNVGMIGFRSSFLFWAFLGGLLALSRMYTKPLELHTPAAGGVPVR